VIRWLRLGLVILTLVVLQTTLIADLRVFGATPSLLLVATLAVAYEDGADAGVAFGFLGGLAIDCFLSTPLGVSALAFALTGWMVGVLQGGLVRDMRFVAPVLGFVGGLFGGTLFVVIATVTGTDDLLTTQGAKLVVIGAALDAIVAPIIFPVVRWARHDADAANWRRR
jgi:rod shape-determining protein MreD